MNTGAQHDTAGRRTSPTAHGTAADPATTPDAAVGMPGLRQCGSATTEDLAAHLAALDDAGAAAFLSSRPDLLTPSSASFTALAARAGARLSVEAALVHLDTPTLAVAEGVVALETRDAEVLAGALGLGTDDVAALLERIVRLGLVVADGPVPGLVEAFGPYPFGLGPAARRQPETLPPPLSELESSSKVSAPVLGLLKALAWGPPVGTVSIGGRAPGAAELVSHGWLVHDRDSAGRTRFVMPRQVALALRDGRLLRTDPVAPDPADLEVLAARTVASEASRRAEEIVRLVGALLAEWTREGGPVLRTGGVGVRALGRTAEALGVTNDVAATVIEAAAAADLLGHDSEGASWVPSRVAASWVGAELPERWAVLVEAWAGSIRTAWLVGRRNDDGTLRPVLGGDVEASWARLLRRRVLELLEGLPEGTAVTPTWVRAALTFARPRRPVPEGAVTAVLAEAEMLGLTGGGALSNGGRVLARSLRAARSAAAGAAGGEDDGGAGSGTGVAGTDGAAEAADDAPGQDRPLPVRLEDALAADLPEPVDALLVQSDLTAVVPGRPTPELAALLELCAVVESRGGALTLRFTADSVRGALDAGYSGEQLVETLSSHSPSPLPGSLTVLVDDVARRHGAVRVRDVASLLRVGDPAVAAGLVADPHLADLGLVQVAPDVLVSSVPSGRVLRELRSAGHAPVLEDASGRGVVVGKADRLLRGGADGPEPAHPGERYESRRRAACPRELAAMVGRLRAGERARAESATPMAAATDPVHALALLRQAQASRTQVRLRLAGQDGEVQERHARVLAVEPGRVRIADVVRETELTVAVHRIVSAEAL